MPEKMNIEQKVKELNNFTEFNPMQLAVLSKPLYERNIVLSAPTASGKTVISELCALNSIINNKKKVIYTCPLRALANEHYSDFRNKYAKELNIKFTISTGDFDSSSKHLSRFDLIFTTYEKLDSLLRHNAEWLSQIGLLVIDEVHTIGSDRGPTIEMVIAKLRSMNPKMQVLALSATIPNSKELAEWMDAELIESNYRPVKLQEGVYFADEITYPQEKSDVIEPDTDAITSLVLDTIKKGKQALVFAGTRRNSAGIAKRLSSTVAKNLLPKEKEFLLKKADEIENALESPTEQCRQLASLVRSGVSFHNAGLMQKQRTMLEDLFRNRHLKVISSTPTLAAGINLPAHTVIIPTLYRFGMHGMERIPVSEYKQMSGRAGRPKFDNEGRAVLLARSDLEAEELMERYVEGEIEPVKSRLGIEPILRTHLLGAIATNFVFDLESMEKFFSRTFYAKQYGNMDVLFAKMTELLDELRDWAFINYDGKRITPTKLGMRVSELYLDPNSAHKMLEAFKLGKTALMSYLFTLTSCYEFLPWLGVPKKKEPELWEQLQEHKLELPINLDIEMYADNSLLNKFNSALLMQDWLDEVTEQNLMSEYNVQPGILHNKLQILDWLSYCAVELTRLLDLNLHFVPLNRLRKRLKYGVREELLPLVEVRGIGRVRARRLWRSNVRTIAELKKIDVRDLGRILGPKVAAQVKGQFS
ncbi:MAG: DEAD/DEAH box helicase [Candidatus Diapherotrites archaeon]|nr:DEAD/DEAH box helicase [Candidatus Micrarchaeota archaeon]MBU1939855.1 DEAD/DEAH box helicase [Candidatus Micrarchaeota archaeon]